VPYWIAKYHGNAMAAKVKMNVVPGQRREDLATTVAVTLKDGRTVTRRVTEFRGTPARPLDEPGMREKFMLMSKRFPCADMDRLYQRALTQHPDDFMLNLDYALALSHLGRTEPGRWKEAIGYFRAGLAIRPQTSGMWRWLGIAYRELADFQQAIAALNQAIDLQDDHAATWVDLGRAKAANGDADGAFESYRRAIDLDDGLAEAHCYFGLLLMEQGRLFEAYTSLQKGHQAGSKDPTWEREHPSAKWLSECERRIAASIRPAEAGGARQGVSP